MSLAGAWTNSRSNGKRRRLLQGPKLTGGKFMQIPGQANRAGLVLLGEARSTSSSILRGAGRQRSGRENQRLRSELEEDMHGALTQERVRTDGMGRADTFEEVTEVERGI